MKVELPIILIFILYFATKPLWAVDEQGATQLLENKGYTSITIEGYKWFACGRGDVWQTKFTALNLNGQKETGTVCEGLFKGKTLRND